MHYYGVAFGRRVLSTFADFDAMLELGPLGKVPILVMADGERLWDSRAILDFLHGRASPGQSLLPHEEPRHRQVLRVEAAAVGLAEKAYERGIEFAVARPARRIPHGSHDWSDRLLLHWRGWSCSGPGLFLSVHRSVWATLRLRSHSRTSKRSVPSSCRLELFRHWKCTAQYARQCRPFRLPLIQRRKPYKVVGARRAHRTLLAPFHLRQHPAGPPYSDSRRTGFIDTRAGRYFGGCWGTACTKGRLEAER